MCLKGLIGTEANERQENEETFLCIWKHFFWAFSCRYRFNFYVWAGGSL